MYISDWCWKMWEKSINTSKENSQKHKKKSQDCNNVYKHMPVHARICGFSLLFICGWCSKLYKTTDYYLKMAFISFLIIFLNCLKSLIIAWNMLSFHSQICRTFTGARLSRAAVTAWHCPCPSITKRKEIGFLKHIYLLKVWFQSNQHNSC